MFKQLLTILLLSSSMYSVCQANDNSDSLLGDPIINWTSNTDGSWFDDNNWDGLSAPAIGNGVTFGVAGWADPIDNVDIDNAGSGVYQDTDTLTIKDKVIFFDGSALGVPAAADDALVFNLIEVNGEGGVAVVFNVPVIADTMTSNRHGGVFNQQISVSTILAESGHQDKWEINFGVTGPIELLRINEQRGTDGGSIDGYFALNVDATVNQLEQVWGNLRIGIGGGIEVNEFIYWDYSNQTKNNNINPINLDGELYVNQFKVYDVENDSTRLLTTGTYGSIGNVNVDFQVGWIVSGDGILYVIDEIFMNSFESTMLPPP